MSKKLTISQQHDALLARPMKHKITKRWYFIEEKFKNIQRPVIPQAVLRLTMLSAPKHLTPKFTPPDIPSTILSRAVLEANCTPRLDHLSRPFVRILKSQKREHYQLLSQQFQDTMNERIQQSYNTIYYHNVKSLMNVHPDRRRAKSLMIKKPKYWLEEGDKERMLSLAMAKKIHPPAPLPYRKWKPVEQMTEYLKLIAHPKHFYRRPSQDSILKRFKVSPETLAYVATDRMKVLALSPAWKLVKGYIYTGKVSPAALQAVMTDRLKELAAPRPRAMEKESDLKDNPYDISPSALKYKATPRIIELAKPVDR